MVHMMKKDIPQVIIASTIVSVPLAFASLSVSYGSWSEILLHPGFWIFYGKAIIWFFLVGISASVLTLILISRKQSPEQ